MKADLAHIAFLCGKLVRQKNWTKEKYIRYTYAGMVGVNNHGITLPREVTNEMFNDDSIEWEYFTPSE